MRLDLLQREIKQLAVDGATDEEICQLHGVTQPELWERFGRVLSAGRAQRAVHLRRLRTEPANAI
jgi:hypothetical protein